MALKHKPNHSIRLAIGSLRLETESLPSGLIGLLMLLVIPLTLFVIFHIGGGGALAALAAIGAQFYPQ